MKRWRRWARPVAGGEKRKADALLPSAPNAAATAAAAAVTASVAAGAVPAPPPAATPLVPPSPNGAFQRAQPSEQRAC